MTALNDAGHPQDTCPADMWAKVDIEQLKKQYDLLGCSRTAHGTGCTTGSSCPSERSTTSMVCRPVGLPRCSYPRISRKQGPPTTSDDGSSRFPSGLQSGSDGLHS